MLLSDTLGLKIGATRIGEFRVRTPFSHDRLHILMELPSDQLLTCTAESGVVFLVVIGDIRDGIPATFRVFSRIKHN